MEWRLSLLSMPRLMHDDALNWRESNLKLSLCNAYGGMIPGQVHSPCKACCSLAYYRTAWVIYSSNVMRCTQQILHAVIPQDYRSLACE
jgi:hypothetical protein